eukprot:gene2727-5506_t
MLWRWCEDPTGVASPLSDDRMVRSGPDQIPLLLPPEEWVPQLGSTSATPAPDEPFRILYGLLERNARPSLPLLTLSYDGEMIKVLATSA